MALSLIPGGSFASGIVRRGARAGLRKILSKGTTREALEKIVVKSESEALRKSADLKLKGFTQKQIDEAIVIAKEASETAPKAAASKVAEGPAKNFWNKAGGRKGQRAWLESTGRVPGAMGKGDVAAMRARGATEDEIQEALLRASKPSRTSGWVKQGSIPTPPPNPATSSLAAKEIKPIETMIRTLKKTNKMSDDQVVNALREQFGIKAKDARAFIKLVME